MNQIQPNNSKPFQIFPQIEENEELCPICLAALSAKDKGPVVGHITQEGAIPHQFHWSCIAPHFVDNFGCPTCKINIINRRIFRFMSPEDRGLELQEAVWFENLPKMELLLLGGDIKEEDLDNAKATAASRGLIDIFKILCKKDPTISDRLLRYVLDRAATQGTSLEGILQIVLTQRPDLPEKLQENTIRTAAREGQMTIIKMLLHKGGISREAQELAIKGADITIREELKMLFSLHPKKENTL